MGDKRVPRPNPMFKDFVLTKPKKNTRPNHEQNEENIFKDNITISNVSEQTNFEQINIEMETSTTNTTNTETEDMLLLLSSENNDAQGMMGTHHKDHVSERESDTPRDPHSSVTESDNTATVITAPAVSIPSTSSQVIDLSSCTSDVTKNVIHSNPTTNTNTVPTLDNTDCSPPIWLTALMKQMESGLDQLNTSLKQEISDNNNKLTDKIEGMTTELNTNIKTFATILDDKIECLAALVNNNTAEIQSIKSAQDQITNQNSEFQIEIKHQVTEHLNTLQKNTKDDIDMQCQIIESKLSHQITDVDNKHTNNLIKYQRHYDNQLGQIKSDIVNNVKTIINNNEHQLLPITMKQQEQIDQLTEALNDTQIKLDRKFYETIKKKKTKSTVPPRKLLHHCESQCYFRTKNYIVMMSA